MSRYEARGKFLRRGRPRRGREVAFDGHGCALMEGSANDWRPSIREDDFTWGEALGSRCGFDDVTTVSDAGPPGLRAFRERTRDAALKYFGILRFSPFWMDGIELGLPRPAHGSLSGTCRFSLSPACASDEVFQKPVTHMPGAMLLFFRFPSQREVQSAFKDSPQRLAAV